MKLFCPRCRKRTLELTEVRLGEKRVEHMLVCRNCKWCATTDILYTHCIPEEVLKLTRDPEIHTAVRESLLIKMRRFDLARGREVVCLEVNPWIRDSLVLERGRRILYKLYKLLALD